MEIKNKVDTNNKIVPTVAIAIDANNEIVPAVMDFDVRNPQYNWPWLDRPLKDDAMYHLWNMVNEPAKNIQNKKLQKQKTDNLPSEHLPLAGNISKSEFILDKDNWFYNNVLKEMSEYLFYKNWDAYYNIKITNSQPPPIFQLTELWVNYQKKHEFNPPHSHGGSFSFVVFMKIPTHWKEQHALSFSANSNYPCASDFAFIIRSQDTSGGVQPVNIPLSPDDEGRILFFPAWLSHMVYPFYGTDEERITISGNISIALRSIEEEKEDNKRILEAMEIKILELRQNE